MGELLRIGPENCGRRPGPALARVWRASTLATRLEGNATRVPLNKAVGIHLSQEGAHNTAASTL
eukprot:353631-Chlamydomonas_euryale.AAC.8